MSDKHWETSVGYLGIVRPELMAFGRDGAYRIQEAYGKLLETDYGVNVLESLSADPRVWHLIGKQVYRNGVYGEFSLEDLAKWHLWRINNVGEEFARKELEAYLDSDVVASFVAVWLSGIGLDTTVPLFDGYALVPFHEMPEVIDKYYESFVGGPVVPDFDRVAVVKYFSATKVRDEDEPFSVGAMAEMKRLLTVVETLALVPNSRMEARSASTYVPENVPFGSFGSFFSSSRLTDGTRDSFLEKVELNNYQDDGYLKKAVEALDSKAQGEREKWSRILQRLSRAKRSRDHADRVLELGIVLEMLLLDDNDSGELRFRLSLRGAKLIEEDFEDRVSVFRSLTRLYDFRSKVAHTGEVAKSSDRAYLAEHIREYERLAERICYHILVNGHPEWTELALS